MPSTGWPALQPTGSGSTSCRSTPYQPVYVQGRTVIGSLFGSEAGRQCFFNDLLKRLAKMSAPSAAEGQMSAVTESRMTARKTFLWFGVPSDIPKPPDPWPGPPPAPSPPIPPDPPPPNPFPDPMPLAKAMRIELRS